MSSKRAQALRPCRWGWNALAGIIPHFRLRGLPCRKHAAYCERAGEISFYENFSVANVVFAEGVCASNFYNVYGLLPNFRRSGGPKVGDPQPSRWETAGPMGDGG